MERKYLNRIINHVVHALLIVAFLLLTPFITKAQTQYLGSQGELIGTSDSRMVVTIEENNDSVTLRVMALGELKADAFCFTLVYQPNSLVLTDYTFTNDIPLALNPSDFGSPVISLDPSFSTAYPTFVTEVMNHRDITSGGATGMRSLKATAGTPNPNVSTVMMPSAGKMIPVYSIFFRKQVPGTALQTSDIGYYNNQGIPRTYPAWTYRGVPVTFAPGGQSESFYENPDLFSYRSPSSLTTHPASNIAETSATLNGNIKRGDFAPANDLIVSGLTSSVNTGKIDYDTISQYGFIYSNVDATILVNEISNKLDIDGTGYDFPDATEIAAGSFTRGSKTFRIVLKNNTVADQDRNYFENITGLTHSTTYYVWSVMEYAFQTSMFYPAVGEKITFTTTSEPTGLINADMQHIVLSPNPAKEAVFLSGLPEDSNIVLSDLAGRPVRSYRASGAFIISIDFEKGTYLVKIDKDGQTVTKKLIVE